METKLDKIEQRAAAIATLLEGYAETLRAYPGCFDNFTIRDIENGLENILNTRQLRRLSFEMYETE